MRERYLKQGIDAFHDHELLEMLLYYCYPRGDTNEIAHKMLKEFGSLHNLFEADVEIIRDTIKCSENVAFLLNFLPELANRYFRSRWRQGKFLGTLSAAVEYATGLFFGATVEHFYVICLNAKRQLINTSLISKGTLDESPAYLREIGRVMYKNNNASCAILAHNHPGGRVAPSNADNETTRVITEWLKVMNVDVLDHIIVAGDKYYAYSSRKADMYVKGFERV